MSAATGTPVSTDSSWGKKFMSMTRRNDGLMAGKRGLVTGVANRRSLAWGVARQLREHGAEVAYSYNGERIGERLKSLLADEEQPLIFDCDVTDEASMQRMFDGVKREWGTLDFLVHAIAYAPKDDLRGRFIDTSAEAFRQSLDVSCYSLAALCRLAEPLLSPGASVLTLTYFGSQRVIPNYNVMGVAKAALEASVHYLAVDLGAKGVRINALSAGPIKTLAAAGISDFRYALKWYEANSPLRRNVTIDEVGGTGVYLLSELARAVTGETIYVDNGYHVVGMKMIDAVMADPDRVVTEVG